ncbi:MAG: DNA polymerase domain-containing protein [Candidatus Woesearchaeota archaeon]
MLSIEAKENDIFLFGRNEDRSSYIIKDTNFKPYFYAEDDNGDYLSIENEKVKKIICKNPFEIIQKRQQYQKTYEADVLYVNRFIIDMFDKIEQEPIRKCYLDIEIKKPETGFDDPFKATSEILCIGCYDNFDDKFTQFVLKDYSTEQEMLINFLKYIRDKDPDMLIAWNGDGFDFPFLLNRIKNQNINPNLIARQTSEFAGKVNYQNKFGVKVEGRILFDLMYAYKKWTSGVGRESFSLDFIAQYEGVGEKEKYKGSLDNLYYEDIDKFILYNYKDVELLKLLDEKLHIVDFFDNLRRICFCKFEDAFMNHRMADCLCLKYAKRNNFVLPSVNKNVSKSYEGGYVHEPKIGLHENVACLDMKSLYPSIMIGFNTSYETILPEYQEGCINGMNKYFFRSEQKGIIPAIVKPLLDRRGKVKKELKKIEDRSSREYKSKYMEQYTLKTTANSFYGVLGYKNFRLYKYDVAAAITYLSRNTIKEVARWFEEKGMEIIYGDTDSIFVSMNDKSIDDFKNLTKEINNYFKNFYRNFGVKDENNIIELQFEKVYKTIFFKGTEGKGVKKKYAGILIWKDGYECNEYQRAGFESIRSDTSTIGRKFLDDILRMIIKGKSKEEIEQFISNFKSRIRTDFAVEDIAIPIGISKPLDKYGNQIHARAARLANERHNAGIQAGDKIKYVYVKNEGRVIAFKSNEYMWDNYQIDYEMMERRLIDLKVAPLFDCLGWNHNYNIKSSKKKKKKVKKLKDIMIQNSLW